MPVLAEISDKIPVVWGYALFGVAIGCQIFYSARCGMRLIPWLEVVLFSAVLGFALSDHLFDRAMRDAILAERGPQYFVGLIAAGMLPVVMGVVGLIKHRKRPTTACSPISNSADAV